MEILALVVVLGVPLVIALTVIDIVGRRVNTWHSDEQVQAAAGVFWDRPAGMVKPMRQVEAAPTADQPASLPAAAPAVPGVSTAGIAQPAGRHAV